MKLLLVSTSCENPIPSFLYSIGLATLKSYVERETDWEVQAASYFNTKWSSSRAAFKSLLDEYKPDVVGLNSFSMNRFSTYDASSITAERGITTVLGGIHASSLYQVPRLYDYADFVVVGEGERTLVEALRCIQLGQEVRGLSGVACRGDGEVIYGGPSELIYNLDELPIPDHSYVVSDINRLRKAHLVTSRGCPGNCNFCSTGAFWGRRVRYRSAEKVIEEIDYLVTNFDIDTYMFHDDTFNVNKQRVLDICAGIKSSGFNKPWNCIGRVTPLDEEMLVAMKDSGCINLTLGLETGSGRLLKTLGKGITLDGVRAAIDICRKVGVPAGFFGIIGHKGETQETINETVSFIRELGIRVAADPMYLLPNTELYEYAKSVGFITDQFWFEPLDFGRYSCVHSLPVYTYENSINQLRQWQQLINQG